MKTTIFVRTLSIVLASIAGISSAVIVNPGEFNTSEANLSQQASGTDLAEGAAINAFFQPNGNGSPALLVDGSVGTTGFNNGGFNGSNGGTAPVIFIDLGSSENIGLINVFTAGQNADSSRQNQIYTVFGSNDPTVDINTNDLTAFTALDSVSAISTAQPRGFGLTSVDLQGQTFQFLAFQTSFVSGGGGGETSIFHEIDVFAIPEPSTILLLSLGFFSMIVQRRRRSLV